LRDGESLILREDRILETVARLRQRILDRFPDSGLGRLCGQLQQVASKAAERSAWIARPILWIRVVSCLLTLALIAIPCAAVAFAGMEVDLPEDQQGGVLEWVQAVESVLNEVILLSVAIFFLFSLETRTKRRRALAAVHELRSIAHIIDMHQLTKDPERILHHFSDTEHSPRQDLTALELNRYLDYCSEMLSLTGKIAALYVQKFNDAQAVAAVSEVEQLSTGLSSKIWQKIMLLQELRESLESCAIHSPPAAADASAPVATAVSAGSTPDPASSGQDAGS
jgi:hypothetical protein